ncbi:MAG: DUF2283 domain-containing protein [Gemmatimonadota bacterium]|jgi:uncharacterized protein YuzE|nr:DUF2283 domain-containing protein [Gemmatimonadota bacterium]
MRLEYFPETDTLYIHLRDGPGADAKEVAPDVVVDLDAEGQAIGIEIEHASTRTDVTNLHWSSAFHPLQSAASP